MHDSTVRLVDLETGQLDMLEKLSPSDVAAVKFNPHLRLITATSLGYDTISIDVGHAPDSQTLLGQSALVREALEFMARSPGTLKARTAAPAQLDIKQP